MPIHSDTNFAIIGVGSLGSALAAILLERGYAVVLGTRTGSVPDELTAHHNESTQGEIKTTSPHEAVAQADVVLITVPDNAIQGVCDQISASLKPGCVVAHCSGALDSTVLAAASRRGYAVASLHPLNTFPTAAAAITTLSKADHTTALYYEGDAVIQERLLPIFEQLGFRAIEIDRATKPLYHAACVFACNLMTALIDVSLQTASAAQLDRNEFWQSIQPLVRTTIDNISEHGTSNALSGPIARGDTRTVARQTKLLREVSTSLANTYTDLSRHALNLAKQKGSIDSYALEQLTALLKHKP